MATSKFDRELRFIERDSKRLSSEIEALAQEIPDDPAGAAEKEKKISEMQESLSHLLRRKKEILDSYMEAGMDAPDISQDLNASVYLGWRSFNDDAGKPAGNIGPFTGTVEDLEEEIESINKEIAEVNARIAKAGIYGDDNDRDKLSMSLSVLENRREVLILRARAMLEAPKEPEAPEEECTPEMDGRMRALEEDNRAIRQQVTDLRGDVSDLKNDLRQIMRALKIDD